jgi:carboxyl-terminal processing protease
MERLMSQHTRRLPYLAILFLAVGGLLGGLVGNGAKAESKKTDDDLATFGQVLALIEDQYVGEADTREFVEGAIEGVLSTLDPHSNYLSADSFSEMRDEQRGKFSGLGIQITKRGPDKPLTIIAPIDGTPAHRAGLQSGDVIAEIEGEETDELTVVGAVRLLKGPKGSSVTITISRPGAEEEFDVTIERADIPIESIRVSHMLSDDTGFVRISNFTSTTADELDRAVDKLQALGMERLVLDLRNNPGGLLEQAVQVAERFVPSGELVVYTRGRIPGSNQDYVAKRGVDRLEIPVVVLVDSSSASASEIVSGAIQDHDMGLVVGETTFGKGLVQRVIPLQDGGALAVTTAKYYTPSGRLIQRDYSDLEEYYLQRGDEIPSDLDMDGAPESREVFYTDSGRKVYGGGGIRPDYVVKSDRAPQLLFRLMRENLIFDYAVQFNADHPELERGFEITAEIMTDFKDYAREREFDVDEAEFEEHDEVISLRLNAQIARVRWDQEEESKVLTSADPQVRKALEVLEEAESLSASAERIRAANREKALSKITQSSL